MAENSSIEWTTHTFNPWEGCTMVSPGCAHCYAQVLVDHRYGRAKWGKGEPRRRTSAGNWLKPLRWNRDAAVTGERPRVFCASLADWLDDEVSIEWLADLLDLVRRTPNLDWLLLTKRPQNFFDRQQAAMMYAAQHHEKYKDSLLINWLSAWWVPEGCEEGEPHSPPTNVWLGTTVEDQGRADERIPLLLSIPARVRFLSCEPLLGPLNGIVGDNLGPAFVGGHLSQGIDWVIVGGESGQNARPMHPQWARSLRDQCQAAGVPYLFKQWGEWKGADTVGNGLTTLRFAKDTPTGPRSPEWHKWPDGWASARVGKKAAGRLLDGVEHNEFPTPAPLPVNA